MADPQKPVSEKEMRNRLEKLSAEELAAKALPLIGEGSVEDEIASLTRPVSQDDEGQEPPSASDILDDVKFEFGGDLEDKRELLEVVRNIEEVLIDIRETISGG